MDTHSTDKLVGGVLIGVIVTAAMVVIFRYLDISSGFYENVAMQAAAPITVAACILLLRSLLLRTVLRSWRNPLVLDADLNATLTGRVFGLVCGFSFGVTLCS